MCMELRTQSRLATTQIGTALASVTCIWVRSVIGGRFLCAFTSLLPVVNGVCSDYRNS